MLLVILAIVVTLCLSIAQSFIGAKVGTDHPVHVFLTRAIRNNGFRLFVRVPRLLNTAYCAAIPLYLHWIVAHFRAGAVFWSERLLNPVINTMHVAVFAGLASFLAHSAELPAQYVGLAACAFALTPQFYHAFSARTFGLSARGTGLLLLTLFFFAAYAVQVGTHPMLSWAALVLLATLLWAFSTFAQQALVIFSVILSLTGTFVPLIGATLGLGVFIALHPSYSLGYLRHTVRFIQTYARELAPLYILHRRYSIWRDLVWDIWVRLPANLQDGVRYAYENSVLVLVFLNPLTVLVCASAIRGELPDNEFLRYCALLTATGVVAMLLTSFRKTRFLGEPERYIEAVTPWAVLYGAHWLYERGAGLLLAAVVMFLVMDLVQLMISRMVLNHVRQNTSGLGEVEKAIRAANVGEVRFCGNNEQFTKLLMHNDWQFAYCLAVGEDYCGMNISEAFSTFPFLRREACERIVASYRINACLLDREQYDTIFDRHPPGLRAVKVAYESARLRLLILDWDVDGGSLPA